MVRTHKPEAWQVIGAARRLVKAAMGIERGASSPEVEQNLTRAARHLIAAMPPEEREAFTLEADPPPPSLSPERLLAAFHGTLEREPVGMAPKAGVPPNPGRYRVSRAMDLVARNHPDVERKAKKHTELPKDRAR